MPMVPVGAEHDTDSNRWRSRVIASRAWRWNRSQHVIYHTLRYPVLLQELDIGGGEVINRVVIADVADDHAVVNAGMGQRDNVRDAERVSMHHFVVNGGGDSAALHRIIISLLLGSGSTSGQ